MKKSDHFLTPLMLLNAFKKYKYIFLRFPNGKGYAVNSKAGILAYKKSRPRLNSRTNYISFKDISFHEYISKKTPFV
jgi:hypothetical protein